MPYSFLTGCDCWDRIEDLKDSRNNVQPTACNEIKKAGCALKLLEKHRMSPYSASRFAWRAAKLLERYKPSESVLLNDAEYLLGLGGRKSVYYAGKVFPTDCKLLLTYEGEACFNDREFGGWLKHGKPIEYVSDIVEHMLAVEEEREKGRKTLSESLNNGKENLHDFTIQFADMLLLSGSLNLIANQEYTAVCSHINREFSDGRKVWEKDGQAETERNVVSGCISLRKLGLSDAADKRKEEFYSRRKLREDYVKRPDLALDTYQ